MSFCLIQVCRGKPGLCQQMNPVNGSIFMEYLLNASFYSYSRDLIEFDRKGDPPGRLVTHKFLIFSDKGMFFTVQK